MKEIAYEWQSSAALAWAFLWRVMAVYIPAELFTSWVSRVVGIPELISGLIAVLVMLASFFIAAHWLRARGFASVKVILVEWADYQRAQSESAHVVQQAVQGDGPASGGSAP